MNKVIKTLGLIGLTTLAPAVMSDTILGVYAGAGIWKTELSGSASQTPGSGGSGQLNLDDFASAEEDNNFMYVALEHPVPIIPNIMLKTTDASVATTGTLSQQIIFDGQTFNASTPVTASAEFSHMDATFYYELLDNYLSLDFGITARNIDGDITISDGSTRAIESFTGTIPMLYLKAQVDLPLTGLYVTASGNAIGYDGHSLTDFNGGIGWQSDGLVLDFGLELGIRSFTLELDNLDDINTNFDISGVYGALTVHF